MPFGHVVADVARLGDCDLADAARAHEFGGLLERRRRAALRAHLRHALRALGGFHHLAALDDGQRERLLHVHVLAGIAGVDEHQRVPVVGRGDDDRVDVFVVQQLVVVVILFGIGARFLDREIHVVVAQVADGHGLLIAVLEKGVVHLIAAVAQADVAHAHAIVGAHDSGITRCRCQCRRSWQMRDA